MKQEGTFKGGKPDKKVTEWYENGQMKAERTWKEGKHDGKWTHWHENGQADREITFKDDEAIESREFYKNN